MSEQLQVICGDATKNGNVELTYKGGCRKQLDITEAYRCIGCGGYFHYDCIMKHFEEEEAHDVARNALKKIKINTDDHKILLFCEEGLRRKQPK